MAVSFAAQGRKTLRLCCPMSNLYILRQLGEKQPQLFLS